jgi:hypothetical protein
MRYTITGIIVIVAVMTYFSVSVEKSEFTVLPKVWVHWWILPILPLVVLVVFVVWRVLQTMQYILTNRRET